jgi:hypothetical protein
MATVGAFSKSTQELAGQSVDMLTKYSGQCSKRIAIINHEKAVLDQAEVYWKNTRGINASDSAQPVATIGKARQSLQPYQDGLITNCPGQAAKLTAARSIGDVLLNYGVALQSLSADEFVAYNPKLDEIPSSLAKLPGTSGQPLLDENQIGAVRELTKLVYRVSILSYRQKQLEQAMGPEQRKQLLNVIQSLSYLTSSYLEGLEKEKIELGLLSSDLDALMLERVLPEPLSVTEVQRQLSVEITDVEKRQEAMKAYVVALGKFVGGFDSAAGSIHEPSDKEIAKEVIEFGKSVYRVQAALDKAF